MGPSLQLSKCVLFRGFLRLCKAARDPYVSCQISSWSVNRQRSYGDFSPTTQLVAVTLTSDSLTLKLVHGVLVFQGPFVPSFVYVGLFVFPLGGGTLAFGYGRPTPATAGNLEIGPRGAGVPGSLPTKFRIRRPFRFPSSWRHAGFRVRSAHPSNSWESWNWSTGCSCPGDPSYQVWCS